MSFSAPSLNRLVEMLMQCTVHIHGKIKGTGFFVAPGLILTCAHVVKPAWEAQTTIDVQRRDNQQGTKAHILQFRTVAYPDLALLQIQETDHCCVLLDQEISLNDQLYAYGYPETYPEGDSLTVLYEGLTGVQHTQLKLKEGQASPGMSGSPLLNLRTGKVCGILRTTRDERSTLGGRAIPVHTILHEFSMLAARQEQFHHMDTQWLRLLPSPTRYSLTNQMVRQMVGCSVQLVQFAKISPASESRRQRYYEGALLSWDILAASADVRRDIHDELLRYAVNTIDQIRMLCLHGESGAGKSTLAWRLAVEVSQTLQRPLLHLRKDAESDIWYKLEDFLTQYAIPSVILVDDIFRDDQTCQVLTSLNMGAPMLIIATARSNEIPANLRLPFDPYYQEVASPTFVEKALVLQKLGRDETMFNAPERKRFLKANSWLVMMLELTTGKDLEKIVQDTINRLQEQDVIVYQAYEYLCFAGQYDLGLPETLLNALDERGRFYKLAEHHASQGLLTIENDTGKIRTQHALIARQSLQLYRRDPSNIGQDLINAVQTDQDDHRTFLARLLFLLTSDQQEILVQKLVMQNADKIDIILSNCSSADLSFYWIKMYYSLHDIGKAIELELKVLNRAPQTTMDFVAHLRLVEHKGNPEQIQQAIEETREWLFAHPQDATVRYTYLILIGRRGNIEQIQQAIEETREWLFAHPQDTTVRYTYLPLIDRKGNLEQIQQAIEETREWLSAHPQDVTVRQTYLALVEHKGNPEQIQQAIEEMREWLSAHHSQDATVRHIYLALVGRNGSLEQIQQAIEETQEWLSAHPQDTIVRQNYLILIGRRGNLEQVRQAIEETREWLFAHPQDATVRYTYLTLIDHKGNLEQVRQAIEETREWLFAHPQDTTVRRTYLALADHNGSLEQIQWAIEETREWFFTHPQDTAVRHSYLPLIDHRGNPEQVRQVIEETREWLFAHPQDTTVRCTYLPLIDHKGSPEQVRQAIEETREWLFAHPQDTAVRHTYLPLIDRKGNPEQVRQAIEETREWLFAHPQDTAVRHTYLPLIDRQGNPEQIQQAIEETREWLSAHPQDTAVRHAYLPLIGHKGNPEQIQQAIEETREWLSAHPQDTAVRQTYLPLIDRKGNPEQVRQVIEETREWLFAHPQDTTVRCTYLTLIDYKGNPEQVQQAIEETQEWLSTHPQDHRVYPRYRKLLRYQDYKKRS